MGFQGIELPGQPKLKIGWMRFRRELFWVMAFISLCPFFSSTTWVMETLKEYGSNRPHLGNISSTASLIDNIVAIPHTILEVFFLGFAGHITVFLSCLSFGVFIFFVVMAWRNGVAIGKAKRNYAQLMKRYYARNAITSKHPEPPAR